MKFNRNITISSVLSGITALILAANLSIPCLININAVAGMQLGEGTFESNNGQPWHVREQHTGKLEGTVSDGVYSVLIKNPGGMSHGGEDKWDCQFCPIPNPQSPL